MFANKKGLTLVTLSSDFIAVVHFGAALSDGDYASAYLKDEGNAILCLLLVVC